MKKRMVSLLLAVVMVFSLWSYTVAPVAAAGTGVNDRLLEIKEV